MSDAVAIQLILSIVTLLGLLITAGVTIWQMRHQTRELAAARAEAARTTEAVAAVEHTVNGKHTEALQVIEQLMGEVRRLNADPESGTTPTTRAQIQPPVTLAGDGSGSVQVTNGDEGK